MDGSADYQLNNPVGGIVADDNAIRREHIDVANLLFPASTVDSPQTELETFMAQNPPTAEEGKIGDDDDDDDDGDGRATQRRRRNRPKFSKLALAATKDFFLLDDKKPLYDGKLDGLFAKGQIEACASKKNGQRYRVAWHPSPDAVLPVGDLDLSHLRQYYDKSQSMMDQLQEAHQVYVQMFGDEPVSKKRKAQTNPASAPTPAPFSTPDRHQRAADLRTGASVFTSSSTRSVVTRGSDTATVESESRDGDDLDERDNSWFVSEDPQDFDSDEEDPNNLTPSVDNDPQSFVNLLSHLAWKFELVEPDADVFTNCPEAKPKPLYSGPHGLRRGVATSFSTPTECFEVVGGFDYRYVCGLVSGTNDYFREVVKPRIGYNEFWNGAKWKDVSISEMYHFLGIILRISIMPMDAGGYRAYFSKEDKTMSTGFGASRKDMTIPNTKGFARDIMTLCRFKQIRGAFHPESREQGLGGDKCYQLRKAINRLNVASRKSFIPGQNLTFDEGGVSCRSRFCPVRQYNKDKPAKFRVDFFILSGANTYEILHIDVYQGRNSANASVHESARSLPTTQKAVVNAIIQTDLDVRPAEGMRHLFLDNRYQCPELAVLCRDQLSIYTTGTTRSKRKGWDSQLMTLQKTAPRGSTILAFDKVNKILISQWNDSKVVKSCTSYVDTSLTQVQRQVGPTKLDVKCPSSLKRYQEHMFGVDKGDQIRAAGGGFANKAHFKKWYKRVVLAIYDCQLLNSLIAWRMSLREVAGRNDFERYDFLWWISEDFLNYKDDEHGVEKEGPPADIPRTLRIPCLLQVQKCEDRCDVCMYETKFVGDKKLLKRNVGKCNCCGMSLHILKSEDKRRLLQQQPEFSGMSCHEIAHSKIGREIWVVNKEGKTSGKRAYELTRKHDVLKRIEHLWMARRNTPLRHETIGTTAEAPRVSPEDTQNQESKDASESDAGEEVAEAVAL